MAGVALAALAHTGLFAAVAWMGPSSGSGAQVADDTFIVTLVEAPPQPPEPEPEPVPQPPPPEPEPVPEPEPEPVADDPIPDHEADLPPAPATEDQAAPISDTAPADIEPLTASESIEMIEEAPSPASASTAEAPAPSAGSQSTPGDGKAEMDAYTRQVRIELAKHAPRGVRGARDCKVEFRLSRSGEVVSVGIRQGSGSRLYDRRCLNAVTSAVPFPSAPPRATREDLSFTIVMQQKR